MGGLALAHLEAGEALDHDALAHLGRRLVDHVLEAGLAGGVADERLLQQAGLGVELLELALDDLVDHLGRLLLVGHLLTVDLPLLLQDRKSTRLNSSHSQISYAVFCLKKKKKQ